MYCLHGDIDVYHHCLHVVTLHVGNTRPLVACNTSSPNSKSPPPWSSDYKIDDI